MFIFGLFLGNPHLKNEKKSQSADNKQNFEILVPLRAKHLKPHNNRLVAVEKYINCQKVPSQLIFFKKKRKEKI